MDAAAASPPGRTTVAHSGHRCRSPGPPAGRGHMP